MLLIQIERRRNGDIRHSNNISRINIITMIVIVISTN